MIKINKIIFLVLLIIISAGKSNAEITDSLFMTIGNKPITKSDIVDEIKIILILNNESYSDDKRDRLHKLAMSSIIKRSIITPTRTNAGTGYCDINSITFFNYCIRY